MTADAAFRAAVTAEARAWVGTPYRHQASLKGVACDCLGLLRDVWRALYGDEPETAPAYSADWAEATRGDQMLEAARRHLLPLDAVTSARPGDVLLFRWRPTLPAKHCAILVSRAPSPLGHLSGRIVHAYDAAGKVAEGNLAREWAARCVAAFAFPQLGDR